MAITCLVVAAGCNWAIPIFYQRVIDIGVLEKDMAVVWKLFFVQISFFMGYVIGNGISSILLLTINFYIGIEYLSGLLHKIIRLPIKYFDTRLNTDFIQRLDDFGRVQQFLTSTAVEQLFAIVNVIVFSVLLANYSGISLVVFSILSVMAIMWNVFFMQERKYLDYTRFSEQARNRNILYELINGMSDVKINNAQDTQIQAWMQNQEHINKIALRSILLSYKQDIGSSTINRLRDIVIVSVCAYFVIEGDMTLGTLMSVSLILGQLSVPISKLQHLVQDFQSMKSSMERLAEIQLKESEDSNNDADFVKFTLQIALKDVDFKYAGSFNPFVFKGLNVTFFKNKTTAIVGNSGSGKSTLLKLILGFYQPEKGAVLVDGLPLKRLDINQWRNKCGVVLQNGYVFSGSIAENIAFGCKEIDDERVKHCARMACIDKFIQRLPNKFNMKIGNGGIELSQGQKQRILIARAIYKNPELLIFDEATSALDTVNERHIMDNLSSFFRERTVIVVAHRLSTVVGADMIIFLDNGKITEQGTHRELVRQRGQYYELIKNQLELDV